MRALNEARVIRMCRRRGRPDLIRKLETRLVQIEETYRTDPGRLVELGRAIAAQSPASEHKVAPVLLQWLATPFVLPLLLLIHCVYIVAVCGCKLLGLRPPRPWIR